MRSGWRRTTRSRSACARWWQPARTPTPPPFARRSRTPLTVTRASRGRSSSTRMATAHRRPTRSGRSASRSRPRGIAPEPGPWGPTRPAPAGRPSPAVRRRRSSRSPYLAIDHRLPQLVEQRLRVLQVARVEAFGEPGVERGEEGAGRVALALALPEPRQAGGGAQLERLGLLPPCDLEGKAEERLRLLDRIGVCVFLGFGPQPGGLGIGQFL